MKKLLLGLTLLASMSSFAGSDFVKQEYVDAVKGRNWSHVSSEADNTSAISAEQALEEIMLEAVEVLNIKHNGGEPYFKNHAEFERFNDSFESALDQNDDYNSQSFARQLYTKFVLEFMSIENMTKIIKE